MSKGWESKSVQAQQADTPAEAMASPAPKNSFTGNSNANADQLRRRQALELQRERILSERTASPHRRTALASALTSIEEELAQLGWTIHL